MLNASIAENGTEMIYHSNHNIGLAMDTPKGLLVPVIKQVQLKSILDIAIELGHLQVRTLLLFLVDHLVWFLPATAIQAHENIYYN